MIAFFDVDHTLINGNSGFYTSFRLVQHGILKKRRILQALFYRFAGMLGYLNIKKIYDIVTSDMTGSKIDDILEIGKECFEKDIKNKFYQEALTLIKKHKQKGDQIVLISSGPGMIIPFIKEYLQADDSYSISSEIVNGIVSSKIPDPLCHAEGKIYYALKACEKFSIPLNECAFYTDHVSDIPLLEKVGKPFAVNPDYRLRKKALKKGWPILNFKTTSA